jgi:Kdo2-lipid IVA lauroyltransferase/acyltransferase
LGLPLLGSDAGVVVSKIAQLRSYCAYLAFRFGAFILGALPLESASALSSCLWRAIAPHLRRHKRACAHIAASYPALTPREVDAMARDMWGWLGHVYAEGFHLHELLQSDRIDLGTVPDLLKSLPADRGVVFCGAHQGNWELLVIGLLRMGYAPCGIYQRVKNPYIDAMIQRMRADFYTAGLLPKQKTSAMTMLRHVRAGGAIALLADLRDYQGVQVPFFGRLAPSTPFPAMIARVHDVPLCLGSVERLPHGRFRLHVRRIDVPMTADRDADIALATARLQSAIEEIIRHTPHEWMWAHRRWG